MIRMAAFERVGIDHRGLKRAEPGRDFSNEQRQLPRGFAIRDG